MMQQRIPATVVTGFLGSGKTTLIRHILENADGKRIALIINEFGDLGVDGEVLRGCGIEGCDEDNVIELTNGCICCTVADDFVPTMTMLLGRDETPDHIIVETSGLALPQPLVQAFNWPGVKERVTVDGVLTVVDAAAVSDGRFAHDPAAVDAQRRADPELDHETPLEELYEDQLRAADLVILNKTDLVEGNGIAAIRQGIGKETDARLVTAEHGRLPLSVLLGLGAATETLIASRPSHHELAHAHHDDHDHHHDHDDFTSFVFTGPPVGDPSGAAAALKEVIAGHDILRLKGFLDVPGKPMRMVVQAVGQRVNTAYDRPWAAGERATRLVVIGLAGIDEAAVRRDLETALARLSVPA
ncbi:MAG: cobalamin biosynthesis protein CobW [Pseudomonadota bacterium]